MRHLLLAADHHFDRAAILRRAWSRARRDVKGGGTLRQALASALRYVWDEARAEHALALWTAQQDAARAHLATLDARSREIALLQFDRFAANGIDNARQHRTEVERIEARLVQLAA